MGLLSNILGAGSQTVDATFWMDVSIPSDVSIEYVIHTNKYEARWPDSTWLVAAHHDRHKLKRLLMRVDWRSVMEEYTLMQGNRAQNNQAQYNAASNQPKPWDRSYVGSLGQPHNPTFQDMYDAQMRQPGQQARPATSGDRLDQALKDANSSVLEAALGQLQELERYALALERLVSYYMVTKKLSASQVLPDRPGYLEGTPFGQTGGINEPA